MQPRYVFFAFCLAAAPLFAQSQTLIDNDQVRVLVSTDQPHVKSASQEHKLNRVMIYLRPGRQEITPQKGKKVTSQFRINEVTWSPARGIDQSEIVSDAPVTMVEVEIKKPGDPAKSASSPLDPVKVAPRNYHVEFENSQVRVVRVRMGPGQSVPVHQHMLNRVVVYLTDQNTRITSTDGAVENAQHKAGEASWGGPAKHQEQNVSDKPFEVVVVELKS